MLISIIFQNLSSKSLLSFPYKIRLSQIICKYIQQTFHISDNFYYYFLRFLVDRLKDYFHYFLMF